MIEWLLLALLPVAAWGGWYFARNTAQRSERKRHRLFNNQYFQGLNYLLNEQPDKAIQIFLEMAEVNEDTVETHLALGSLFRRRGEVDRAIRLHQNIISKHTLDDTQRLQALLELGEDYMRAGLFDRAEKLFSELMERESQAPSALKHLLDIYQQEKDWAKALDVATRLEAVSDEYMALRKSQFCCELAELELDQDQPGNARKHLALARRFDPANVRAHFISARIAQHNGKHEEAMGIYEEVAQLDHNYLPILLDPYFQCAEESGQLKRAQKQLESWCEKHQSTSALLKKVALMEQDQGAAEAARHLAVRLGENPSVQGLEKLLDLSPAGSEMQERTMQLLHSVTRELLSRQSTFRCSHCGFSGQNHHWQCPSCKQWSTTRVIRGVLGE
ncbi:MAG: lipopolysaccharide assembly protein LapB [Xanthomonadales bacterium]|nr:lipopolysaccharide assembly protein LapB [Xanthomonadales bacterium]